MTQHEQAETTELINVPRVLKSNVTAQTPLFTCLIGEQPLLVSKIADGNAMITNFRFVVVGRQSFINLPLVSIDVVQPNEHCKSLKLSCKDASTFSCTFATLDDLQQCMSLLKCKLRPQNQQDVFAYTFYNAVHARVQSAASVTEAENDQMALCGPVSTSFAYSFGKEVERMGFDTNRRRIWRMSHANEDFEFCATYPKYHILPATVDDESLWKSLNFRALSRFPSVVWRNRETGVVLIRSSQPLIGFLGMNYYSNENDVELLKEIVNACKKDSIAIEASQDKPNGSSSRQRDASGHRAQGDYGMQKVQTEEMEEEGAQGPLMADKNQGSGASNDVTISEVSPKKELMILDCRSFSHAWGNSFKGGGTEDETVYNCDIKHLDLANIHHVRSSFLQMRDACHLYNGDGTFFVNLLKSQWLKFLQNILRGANMVVDCIQKQRRPTLVHCSDGWDRTAQICSLAELMMDSYYRTLEGFQMLVEREWLQFGHKFGERGGHDPKCSDHTQVSPVFLQFLDCVYQLTLQYPSQFQFNETYLVKLVKHSQACLFGNFLLNSEKERSQNPNKSASIWTFLQPGNESLLNPLYKQTNKVIQAAAGESDMVLWKNVYLESNTIRAEYLDSVTNSRSMENLSNGESAASGHDESNSSGELVDYPDNHDSGYQPLGQIKNGYHQTIGQNENGYPSVLDQGENGHSQRLGQSENGHHFGQSENGHHFGQSKNVHLGETQDGHDTPAKTISPDDTSKSVHSPPKKQFVLEIVESGITASGNCEKIASQSPQTLQIDGEVHDIDSRSSAVFSPQKETQYTISDKTTESNGETGVEIEDSLNGNNDSKTKSSENNSFINSVSSVCDKDREKSENEYEENGDKSETAQNSSNHSPNKFSVKIHNKTSLLSERLEGNLETDLAVHRSNGEKYSSKPRKHSHRKPESCKELPPNSWEDLEEMVHLSKRVGFVEEYPSDHSIKNSPGNECVENISSTDTIVEEKLPNTKWSPTYNLQLEVDVRHSNNDEVPITSSHSQTERVQDTSPPLASKLLSRRARAASGASRDVSVSPCSNKGNWSDTGRLCNANDSVHRGIGATVSTSTTDISDSHIGQIVPPCSERQTKCMPLIDVDSLNKFQPQEQILLAEILSEKDQKINELECKLSHLIEALRTRRRMMEQQQPHQQHLLQTPMEDFLTDTESGEHGSMSSVSNVSNAASSDVSWDQVEENEARMVLWVPDHSVTHCAACDGQFWMGRRRHHCRSCGKIFCADCSSYRAPVPHEHLDEPQRVCQRCHEKLLQLSPGASSDGRIMTLVSEG